MTRLGDVHAVIPAGGAGTRLWPLSRSARPKFLLDLTGSGRSLLQQTWDRLTPLAASVTVVTGALHAQAVAEHTHKRSPSSCPGWGLTGFWSSRRRGTRWPRSDSRPHS